MIPLRIAFAVLAAAAAVAHSYDFGVGGRRVLCVPLKDLDSTTLPYADVSTHLNPGNGHTPGVPFSFDAVRVSRDVPAYVLNAGFPPESTLNAVVGEIDFVSTAERKKYGPAMRAFDTDKIWAHSRKCSDLRIFRIPRSGFYFARCLKGSQRILLLNRLPDPKIQMPDPDSFVVAVCKDERPVEIGPYKGATDRSCMRTVMIHGFLADYRFPAEDARLVSRLDDFLSDVISRWKVNCRGEPA